MKLTAIVNIVLLLIPLLAYSSEKPVPPPGLMKLTTHFKEIEGKIEERNLAEALKHYDETNVLVQEIQPSLKKHTHRLDRSLFLKKFAALKDNLQTRNSEFIQQALIDVQKTYFILTEYYNIQPPLFLQTIGHFLDEAREEGLEEKNFEEIERELEEISEFVEYFDKSLLKHGISNDEIEKFVVLAFRTKRAAKAKDYEKSDKGLRELKEMYLQFVKQYK